MIEMMAMMMVLGDDDDGGGVDGVVTEVQSITGRQECTMRKQTGSSVVDII